MLSHPLKNFSLIRRRILEKCAYDDVSGPVRANYLL